MVCLLIKPSNSGVLTGCQPSAFIQNTNNIYNAILITALLVIHMYTLHIGFIVLVIPIVLTVIGYFEAIVIVCEL